MSKFGGSLSRISPATESTTSSADLPPFEVAFPCEHQLIGLTGITDKSSDSHLWKGRPHSSLTKK